MDIPNFKIYNSSVSENTTEIDIFSDIGESWWDESTSFQDIKTKLDGIDSDNIKINLATFGGDVNHAFAISNILKTNKAKVTANIMGFTASAGTIIALAADEVRMDENTMFLVHNAWTWTAGNQHDHRATADELEKIDNRLISIYKAKTGKRKDTIHNLMKEEKWITAKEAEDFGFIDEVYEPIKAAASYQGEISKINNYRHLPVINSEDNQNTMDEKKLNELKTGIVTEVVNNIKNMFAKKDKEVSDTDLENAVKAQVDTELKAITDGIEVKITEYEEGKVALETEKTDLQNKVTELEGAIDKYKATGVVLDGGVDPDPDGGGAKPNEPSIGGKVLEDIFNRFTPGEKIVATKNGQKS